MEREKPYWFSECLKNCVAHWLAKKLNLKIGGKVPGKEENEAVEKVEETKVEPKTVSVLDRLEANFNAGSFQDACKTVMPMLFKSCLLKNLLFLTYDFRNQTERILMTPWRFLRLTSKPIAPFSTPKFSVTELRSMTIVPSIYLA